MAMSVTVTLVDVLNVVPGLEVVLTEGPPGTWTVDTMIEKRCHDCRLQYNVPFVVVYVPNSESWEADACTVAMDGSTEYGGTFAGSMGSLVSEVVDGDTQTRVTEIQPGAGHGYLTDSTITFTYNTANVFLSNCLISHVPDTVVNGSGVATVNIRGVENVGLEGVFVNAPIWTGSAVSSPATAITNADGDAIFTTSNTEIENGTTCSATVPPYGVVGPSEIVDWE